MTNASQPIKSPIGFYDPIGMRLLAVHCTTRKPLASNCVVQPQPALSSHTGSRDFSSHPRTPHPCQHTRLQLAALLLLALSGCTAAADAPQFLILKLPASFVAIVLTCTGTGLAAGFGLGIWLAIALLRAADTAASQYHSRMVATVLDASSSVHALVTDIVATASNRIAALRRELRRLKEAQS